MVKIVFQKFGEISGEVEKKIVSIIEECYDRLKPYRIEILDLLLFKKSSEMRVFYAHERSSLGVVSEDFSERFFAMHDAWRGTPRITVCLEIMGKIPDSIQRGSLQHEVGHSVLHGSLEYYLFPLPPSLINTSREFKISKEFMYNLLYLISIAVKDYEVTKLLVEKGYFQDQLAYTRFLLTTSNEELSVWEMIRGNPSGMALYLAGRLKDAACFIPLQSRLSLHQISDNIKREFSYLPGSTLDKTVRVINTLPGIMTEDTFTNVNLATKIFVKDLLIPLFKRELT